MHGHLDEGTVHAWLDGALARPAAERVAAHAAACGACAAVVAEARGLIAGSTRILASLDDVPGDVVPRDRGAGDAAGTLAPHMRIGGAPPAPRGDIARDPAISVFSAPRPLARWRWLRDPRSAVAAALLLLAVGVTRTDVYSRRAEVASDALARLAPTVVWAAPAPRGGPELASAAPMALVAPSASVSVPTSKPASLPAELAAEKSSHTEDVAMASSERAARIPSDVLSRGAATAERRATGAIAATSPASMSVAADSAAAVMRAEARRARVARTEVAAGSGAVADRAMTRSTIVASAVASAPPPAAAPPARTSTTVGADQVERLSVTSAEGVLSLQQRFTAGPPVVGLRGRVVDQHSAAPIEGVQVRVAGTGFAAVTDSAGRFALMGTLRDSVRVQVRRIGYASEDTIVLAGTTAAPVTLALAPMTTMLSTKIVSVASAAEAPGPCYAVRRGRGAPKSLPAVVTLGEGEGEGAAPGTVAALREPLAGDSVLVRIGGAELRLDDDGTRLRGTVTDSTGARGRVELRRRSCPAK